MQVRFRVNLGTVDAGAAGLDAKKCQAGMECEVPDAAGEWLVKKGIAVVVKTIKGVAPAPAITAPAKDEPKPAPLAAKFTKPTSDKES